MSLLNCDIIKIITNFDDFTIYKNEFLEVKILIDEIIKKPLIFFQLGDGEGKKTRLLNTFFLPVFNENLAKPTGKGQLSLNELKKITEFLYTEKKTFEYNVLGSSVNFSPSPKIYENCMKFYNDTINIENIFEINFNFKNINAENNENYLISEKEYFEKIEFYKILFSKKLLFASITIPFKTYLIEEDKFLSNDKILNNKYDKNNLFFSQESIEMQSINCIKKVNENKILCYNTDWIGNYELFVEIFEKLNKNISEIKILVLGAGGAANAIIFSLTQFNFSLENIYVHNRTLNNAKIIAEKFSINLFTENLKEKSNYDIIISTIPRNCETMILEDVIDFVGENSIFLDLAYTKPGTNDFTNFKKLLGLKTKNYINGIVFLLKQAYYSFELFYSRMCPRKYLKKIFLENDSIYS